MPAVAIIGAQWGDEGKGKVVDLFTEEAEMVARYAGGANAGHTLYLGNTKVVMRLVPSGVLRPGVKCVLGQGMVVDPLALDQELRELLAHGRDAGGDILVSERAHLVLPYHKVVDELREKDPGLSIGTTKRGIGPAYEDKVGRRGIQAQTIRYPGQFRAAVDRARKAWAPTVAALGGELASVEAMLEPLQGALDRLLPMLGDASRAVNDALKAGKRVLLEGAQGTLLDVDHGTYPFVTSSSSTAGGACTGLGLGPRKIRRVVGVTKAYTTRVGGGPFPTELNDAIGQRIRANGGEFGSVTGRPRRCGWLDLPALRYAAQVNGMDGLALTKLDVLTGFSELRVCVAYDTPEGRTLDLPDLGEGFQGTPVYVSLPGWSSPISGARRLEDLPPEARRYLDFIEEQIDLPFDLISVGPHREETIIKVAPFPS
ncbi:MAG: adenylosuccinate synthase [Myxococcales bacterium]|nr:adenylosuccinate synthase [Polyangiaceae bacterium]MDW8249777.1 adenylosuccinate synthase [Myxococcales bacterium]